VDAASLRSVAAAIRRRWWLLLLVLVTTLAAVAFYTVTSKPTYLARATLIISPSSTVDRGDLVYSVDSLGRGRIVGTYVEVLGSEVLQQRVLDKLGYPPNSLNRAILFKVASIADTAVIQVTAEGPEPEISARAANAIGEVGIEQMGDLYPVYSLRFLTQASPPLLPYRPDPVRNYSLGLLIGLLLGATAAFLLDLTLRGRAPRTDEQLGLVPSANGPNGAEPRALPAGPDLPPDEAGAPRYGGATAHTEGTARIFRERTELTFSVDGPAEPTNGHADRSFEPRPRLTIESTANGQADPPDLGSGNAAAPRPSFDDIEARLAQLQQRLRSASAAPGGTRAGRAAEDEKPADE
jgi:capsular polysaccharide biosynthesis protein